MEPHPDAQELDLIVARIGDPGAEIREVVLCAVDGGALPPFSAGAHVRVAVPGGGANAYSLIDLDGRCGSPSEYVLAVRLDPAGAGGSKWMHGLRVGDRVSVCGPQNDFALDAGASPVLLMAGGIGVTPLISMATALAQSGREWRLHYAARTAAAAAYGNVLMGRHGDRVTLHHDDVAGGPLPVAALVRDVAPDTHVYVCGPRPMIEAVREAAEAAGIPHAQVHMELFDAPVPQAGDAPFEVEVASTGQVFVIPPKRTIVEVLEENGIEMIYDCQRGDCGICQTTVLEGVPDHRDVVLSEAERAAGNVMQICVSRAKSPRLKLDL